mmetsp:Transcript_27392/g.78844  ORF Transcript_27392/g.78844 Transcript_27392/m.78844 type:complete len:124 (-) Transcript_27392:1435-1806(-)
MMVRFVLVVVVVSLAVAAAKPQETLKKGKGKGSHRQQPKQTAECLATPIRAFVGEVATLPLSEFLTFAEGLPGGPELLGEAVTNVTVSPPFDDEANGVSVWTGSSTHRSCSSDAKSHPSSTSL